MESIFHVIINTSPDVNLVYRLDSKGIMVYHYPTGPTSMVGIDFSFRDYFQRTFHTNDALVSQGRISPTTNQAVATAVMPLWSADGKFLGLVGANIKLESLSQTLVAVISHYQTENGLPVATAGCGYPETKACAQRKYPRRFISETCTPHGVPDKGVWKII